MTNSTTKNPIELEAKLIVCSKRPLQIFAEIAELKKVENYYLIPKETILLQDVYWDNPNGSLQKNKISLRTRSENSKKNITIKGATEITSWGAVKRKETEVPWTQNGYDKIIEELVQSSINVPDVSENFNIDSSKTSLKNLGFIVIQDRKTKRQVINIKSENEKPILAEFVLDSVNIQNASSSLEDEENRGTSCSVDIRLHSTSARKE